MPHEILHLDDPTAPQPAELPLLAETLATGRLSGGAPIIERYEKALAEQFGVPYALAVSSGSAALHAALATVGARDGKKVLVPAVAPLPSILPILAARAVPVFVDTKPDRLEFDAIDLQRCLENETGIRALLTVSLWGYPFDVRPVRDILQDHTIATIEDASHAHGSLLAGRQIGSDADLACFSTHDCKTLSTGEGGFVLCHDPDLYQRIESYCRLGHLSGHVFGVNYKLGALGAALGLARLPTLHDTITQRNTNAAALLGALPETSPLHELSSPPDATPNHYALVLYTPNEKGPRFAAALAAQDILTDRTRYGYHVSYTHDLFRSYQRSCPNAWHFVENTHQLPVDPHLGETLPHLHTSTLAAISRTYGASS